MPRRPITIWITGLSGAGKTTLARGLAMTHLDGDILRGNVCRDLGFSPIDRTENINRVITIAAYLNSQGQDVVCSFITPYKEMRDCARLRLERLLLVYLSTPLKVCEARDVKGLYAQARAGKIPAFTGVSAPYEVPLSADLVLDTSKTSETDCLKAIRRSIRDLATR